MANERGTHIWQSSWEGHLLHPTPYNLGDVKCVPPRRITIRVYHAHSPFSIQKVIKEYNIGRVEWFRHLGIQSTDPQTSKAGCTGTLAEASSTGSSTASPDAIHRIDVLIYCFFKRYHEHHRQQWFNNIWTLSLFAMNLQNLLRILIWPLYSRTVCHSTPCLLGHI